MFDCLTELALKNQFPLTLTILLHMIADQKNLIGANLRRMRMERGWTQQHTAEECLALGWDLSRAGLSKIEAGIRRVNDAELILLGELLQVPMVTFFADPPGARKMSRKRFMEQVVRVARHSRDS